MHRTPWRPWLRQLAQMYQGLLFLDGHFSRPEAPADPGGRPVPAAGAHGHGRPPGATTRPAGPRGRAATVLSLFR
ncbi:hypothetical protein [Pseudoxanthomonas sp. 10H]|uniref:hypothetical protein n=1 Tax=Pseudoxanthomonas sp. 10H TaxID=3242729 RepID=UPI003557DBC7